MPTTIHVSPRGLDSNAGTPDRPVASLHQALGLARTLRDQHRLAPDGLTILLEPGDHHVRGTVHIAAADSGTPDAPVRIRAAQPGATRILGGRFLHHFEPVTDPAILGRLSPGARGHVLRCDLRAHGIDDFGALASRGFARGHAVAHLEVWFDGRPLTLARYPNDPDWLRIHAIPEHARRDDGHGGVIGDIAAGFLCADPRPAAWTPDPDIWAHGFWTYDWANSYQRVTAIDGRPGLVQLDDAHYGFRAGQRFYFLNVLEELDAPGEYYVDRQAGVLYLWPPAPVAGADVLASADAGPALHLDGASCVRIEGLAFLAFRSTVIQVVGGSDCLVAGCTLAHLGADAVRIDGGRRHGVLSCDIFDTGDGGVRVAGGDRRSLTPCGHFVRNCLFHHQARWSRCYHPAVHLTGVGVTVANNLVRDHPHCAILYDGNDHLIELNEVHRVCTQTGDVGAIYAGRDWTCRGNLIRHNYLHDIHGPGALGSIALYLDDCLSGIALVGNIVHRTQMGVLIGGGRDCLVDNNLFLDADPAVQIDGRGVSDRPVWADMVRRTLAQRLHAVAHHQSPYSTRFPQLRAIDRHLDAGRGVPAENNRVTRNLFAGRGRWLVIHWGAQPQHQHVADNLTDGDLGLVNPADPAADRFALRPDSPAWKLGFTPIPIDRIGLQPDPFRPTVAEPTWR